jgi:hypothetical protein
MQFPLNSIHLSQIKRYTLPKKKKNADICNPSPILPIHQIIQSHPLDTTQYFNNFCPPLTSTPSLAKLHHRSLMLMTSYVPSSCTGIRI